MPSNRVWIARVLAAVRGLHRYLLREGDARTDPSEPIGTLRIPRALPKALSKEVGPRGVRVNTVSPGPVATDLWLGDQGVAQAVSHATGANAGDVAREAAQAMVTGRFSRPEEVADLVLLLASDRTANVTGSDFRIDGGLIPTW